jgi:CBS domain-containing protein
MKVAQICTRQVEVIAGNEPLASAARQMRDRRVGALIVVSADKVRVVGILTDRDIVCAQVQLKKDLHCMTVEDAMTPDPLSVDEDSDVSEAIRALNGLGVRRAPVINGEGRLTGIVAVDDLVPALAQQLLTCAQLLAA